MFELSSLIISYFLHSVNKLPSSNDVLQITYVTVGKEVYLLEVPESLQGSVPRDYELRSSRKVRITREAETHFLNCKHFLTKVRSDQKYKQ